MRLPHVDGLGSRPRLPLGLGIVILLGVVVIGLGALWATRPAAPAGEPPVLAGRQLWGSCAGGFHARLGDTIVVTSSAHCATEGTTAYEPDGRTVRGTFGPAAVLESCAHEATHTCRPSDMNYLVIAKERIPWGRLHQVDLGDGGVRSLDAGTAPLTCADIGIGDPVEINGRDIHRSGTVAEKGEYLHDPAADGDYFPCIVAAGDIEVGVGDSGGAVLVRGLPAGVTSRSFGGLLGFTPLAEGLAALGLELCTTPDCGLDRPGTSAVDQTSY
jgi:hypothetical protein